MARFASHKTSLTPPSGMQMPQEKHFPISATGLPLVAWAACSSPQCRGGMRVCGETQVAAQADSGLCTQVRG